MRKSLLLFYFGVVFLLCNMFFVVDALALSTGVGITSLPPHIQSCVLKRMGAKGKIKELEKLRALLQSNYNDIDQLTRSLPKELTDSSNIPDLEKLGSLCGSFYSLLEFLDVFCIEDTWIDTDIDYLESQDFKSMDEKIKSTFKKIDSILLEIEVFFAKCQDLQICVRSRITLAEIAVLRKSVLEIIRSSFLFPISNIMFDNTQLAENTRDIDDLKFLNLQTDWASIIMSLPRSIKKIHFINTNVDMNGLKALSYLENLEEIYLPNIELLKPSCWDTVVKCLPESLKKLDVRFSNFVIFNEDTFSHLKSLEELDLQAIILYSAEEWEVITKALPKSIKLLNLYRTNINARALIELNRLVLLEELVLTDIKILGRSHWKYVIQSLPNRIRKIRLGDESINAQDLLALKHLELLEKVSFSYIELSNQDSWVSVINVLPKCIKEITFFSCNINTCGLIALHRFTKLKKIRLYNTGLSNPNDWVYVIQSLPEDIIELDLSATNIDVFGLVTLNRLSKLEKISLERVELSSPKEWELVVLSFPEGIKTANLAYTNINPSEVKNIEHLINLERIDIKNHQAVYRNIR